MAVVSCVRTQDNDLGFTTTWTGLANGDTGAPADLPPGSESITQVTGVFGSGGTVTFEASLDGGTTWGTIEDKHLGTAKTAGDSNVMSLGIIPILVRPNVTAGDGTTDLIVYIHSHTE